MKKLYLIVLIALIASCKNDPASDQTNLTVMQPEEDIAYWTIENLAQEVLNDTYQQT